MNHSALCSRSARLCPATANDKHYTEYEIFKWGQQYIRGLGFKFVDFLNKSSDVCHTEIKMISSENTFFYLLYKILSLVLIIIVSSQQ